MREAAEAGATHPVHRVGECHLHPYGDGCPRHRYAHHRARDVRPEAEHGEEGLHDHRERHVLTHNEGGCCPAGAHRYACEVRHDAEGCSAPSVHPGGECPLHTRRPDAVCSAHPRHRARAVHPQEGRRAEGVLLEGQRPLSRRHQAGRPTLTAAAAEAWPRCTWGLSEVGSVAPPPRPIRRRASGLNRPRGCGFPHVAAGDARAASVTTCQVSVTARSAALPS